MNKTIIININSIVFHIEEEAYETLRSYMIEIKRHFSQTPDNEEILLDIENRIAEMFTERIQQGKKEVITTADVDEVIGQMGRVSDFEEVESDEEAEDRSYAKSESKIFYSEKKLMRDAEDKVLGGVCSGLGYYLGIQARWVRVFFVLFFLLGGSGVLLYVVLWLVMPQANTRAERMAMKGETPNLQNFKRVFEEDMENDRPEFEKAKHHISKGAEAVGNGLSSVLRFFGRFFGFILLIISGMVIFSMFGMLIFGLLGIFTNYVDVLPPLEYLSQYDAFFGLIAGVLAISIPFIALFYLLTRALFKVRPMNNYLSLGLWAAWLMSVIMLIFLAFDTNSMLSESSTVKVEQRLQSEDTYYIAEKDLRVVEASTTDSGEKKLNVNGKKMDKELYSDIRVNFEPIDSLSKPFVQLDYIARGRNRQMATDFASQIDYGVQQVDNKIWLDSHFTLNGFPLKRQHRVNVTIFLPVGAKVVIDENLEDKVDNISLWDCASRYDDDHRVKQTEWVMHHDGLVCALAKKDADKDDDKED